MTQKSITIVDDTQQEQIWRYFAIKRTMPDGVVYYMGFSTFKELLVSLYGAKEEDIVEVDIKLAHKPLPEDWKELCYIGWLSFGEMGLIQHSMILFNMQFAYGYRAAEEHSKGTAVTLNIEEVNK